jgi:uncharacterized membrane protein YccC
VAPGRETTLSTRAKEAIKTGLAMSLAFGVALSMDWDRPYWAGFAVAVISLSTAGQSLNKGAMRLVGTFLAAFVALTLLALVPQQRWLFLMGLSVWVGFCTYMLTGKSRQYFWFVSGFAVLIIALDAGATPQSAFQVAIERVLETGLGIVVYTMVSVLLWPQNSERGLHGAVRALLSTQFKLYDAYRGLMAGRGTAEESRSLRLEEVQLLTQAGQMLYAAGSDTYVVWEARHSWRRLLRLSGALMETLERWRAGQAEIRHLDVSALFPNLDAVLTEIDARLGAVEVTLSGAEPTHPPAEIALEVNREGLRGLSHFDHAAVAILKKEIDGLETNSRQMLDCARHIAGREPERDESRSSRLGFALDPDRLEASLRVVATLCLAFLIWVYVDPPGHVGFVQIASVLAMAASLSPTLNPLTLMGPLAFGCLIGGASYIFVMPQLSSYTALGLLIFGVTTGIYYYYWKPQQGLAKMGAIIPFVVLISVTNEQSYSFAGYANTAVMIMLAVSLVVAVSSLPPSRRPEKLFLRLVGRFFRGAEALLEQLALDLGADAKLGRRARREGRRLLDSIPRLDAWGQGIDHTAFAGATAEQVGAYVASLNALARRIDALRETRELPQAPLLVQTLGDGVRSWRMAVRDMLKRWSEDPGADLGGDLAARLETRLEQTESQTDEAFRLEAAAQLSDSDYENFYELLGGYRGLSESVVAHAHLSDEIDLTSWREARF